MGLSSSPGLIVRYFGFLGNGRFWLAGPLALFVSIAVMAAMPHVLPAGTAGIDHLVFPLLLFPLVWTGAFMYAILETRLGRCAGVLGGFLLLNGGLVAASIAGLLS
ncbi:hypothetical protein OLMES_5507 [Oleiphilus messinensis]|uniref:Uncharacterized protein n=1 Tax=Oleiphilus messinensis TaxID=141451 RepID=A0A1Y0IG60_9GAMM|nr:hypothetical protein [Oleiphilus messinensis]ARU59487.1 hypothetical protein OLMES_5507 [Oleiphilus messinensis]